MDVKLTCDVQKFEQFLNHKIPALNSKYYFYSIFENGKLQKIYSALNYIH